MFSRPDLDHAVADVQALLGRPGPDTGTLDEARLARIRQAVTPRTARRGAGAAGGRAARSGGTGGW